MKNLRCFGNEYTYGEAIKTIVTLYEALGGGNFNAMTWLRDSLQRNNETIINDIYNYYYNGNEEPEIMERIKRHITKQKCFLESNYSKLEIEYLDNLSKYKEVP